MARPLKINYDGTNADGLIEMSDSELDYAAHQIASKLALESYTSLGALSMRINPSNTSGEVIGTFIDTRHLQQQGEAFIDGQISSESYIFRQQIAHPNIKLIDISRSGTPKFQRSILSNYSFIITNWIYENNTPGVTKYNATPIWGDIHRVYIYDGIYNTLLYVAEGVMTQSSNGVTGEVYFDQLSLMVPANLVNNGDYRFAIYRITQPSNIVRPLEFSSSALRESPDSELNAYIFPRVIDRLSSNTLGSYVLQRTAPTTGTWLIAGTIYDKSGGVLPDGTTPAVTDTAYLWICTSYPAPTTARPVKTYTAGVREMSDDDMKEMFGAFRSYVSSTGRGKYVAASTAPTTGTWAQMGDVWNDTRQLVGGISYSGVYSGTYTIGAYAGSREKGYVGTRGYVGSRQNTYSRSYSGYTRANYTGTYSATYVSAAATYTGTYSSSYGATNYAGDRTKSYTGQYILDIPEEISNIKLWLRTA